MRIEFESGEPRELSLELDARGRWVSSRVALECGAGESFEASLRLGEDCDALTVVAVPDPLCFVPVREPPTVVLVTSDTHRGDHVEGAPRAVAIETPALRALAERGVTFTDCFSSTNVTIPSHVAMLTGLAPLASGVTDNRTALSDEPPTLAERFRDAGWHTLAVTSLNLLSPENSRIERGFERTISPPATRAAEKSVEAALRLLDDAPDRPVFLWLHVFDAHGPYEPPAELARKFYGAAKNPRDASIEPEPGMRVPPYLPGVRDAEYVRALYRAEIANQDASLARLFELPRVRRGVVAFTGDHGEVLGRHDIWWAHKDLYPDTLHVPLILAWPEAAAGTRSEVPRSNVDLGRTLLDLAGLRRTEFPGRNLTGEIPASEPRFALGGGRTEASITRDGLHLILQLATSTDAEHRTARERHAVELYDLRADPECSRELSLSRRDDARALRSELVRWLAGWRGERFAGSKRTDAQSLKQLAELGYGSAPAANDASEPLIDAACSCERCAAWK